MGTTRRAGDMPDTVIDLLEREWEVRRTSPALGQALRRWGREDEVLGQFTTIDALVAFVHARRRPAREREAVLVAFAVRAGVDELAAQVLLQLLLPGCKALVAAFGWLGDSPGERAADVIGDVWARLRTLPPTPRPQWVAFPKLGDAAGTRALIEVLLLHRSVPRDSLLAGMRAGLAVGSVDPEVVAIEARKVAERAVAPVVPIGALSRYDRPKPTLNGYDTLLEASS